MGNMITDIAGGIGIQVGNMITVGKYDYRWDIWLQVGNRITGEEYDYSWEI